MGLTGDKGPRGGAVLSCGRNSHSRLVGVMEHINVNTPSQPYAVLIERGLIHRTGHALSTLRDSSGVFVLSSPRVWKHWGKILQEGMNGRRMAGLILFADGERAKTIRTYQMICRKLVRLGADREALLVALGGGVVGDVAGFVAATYLRGVRLVHVPTTLVAQVDSAIGGKTGVNLPEGKNLIGVFHQPALVLADPQVLATLPAREYRAGLYEALKYGILGDAPLFARLEQSAAQVLAQSPEQVDWLVMRCVQAKAGIVARDERESGLRECLNLGHTFAHALEAATSYRAFRHGEAVGWGLIAAARLAVRLEKLKAEDAARIEKAIRGIGRIPPWPRVTPGKLLETMRGDKKARGGRIRFVLPTAIGSYALGVEASPQVVTEVLQSLSSRRAAS